MSKAIELARKKNKLLAQSSQPGSTAEKFELSKYLFKQQLDFVLDPADFKTAVCSRRSGKTVACAAHMIDTAINNPGVVCLYVTLSRALAKKIVWKELLKINDQFNLKGRENKSELSLTFPNGSSIYLSGAGTIDQVANFRGMALKVVYVDEAQSFRSHIEELCNDVFGPALADHAGTLILIGTPSPLPIGFFHHCAVDNQEWSHHKWTFWDNPHIAIKAKRSHREILDRELRRRGVPETDPSIRREWFGEWSQDDNSLLLHYDAKLNDYSTLPPGQYNYILSIDLGFDDSDALSVLAYSNASPVTYLVEEIVTDKQTTDDLVTQILGLNSRYQFVKMVADTGGLGKKIVESLKQRYGLPIEKAEKAGKIADYAILDNALRTGKFKARANTVFAKDCFLLEKDRDKSTPERIVVRGHSDAVDSVLYGFYFSPAYHYVSPPEKHQPGTREHDQELAEQIWEHQAKLLQKQREDNISWETDKNGVPSWLKYQD